MRKVALGFFAHPDDAEFMCAGTLSLLRKDDWKIHIATLTPGDKGSNIYCRKEVSIIRKNEAKRSAKLIQGEFHCLDYADLFIEYNEDTINTTTSLISGN
jgi:LmbE family N-acetylglucosaminyl deacetylase